MAYTHVPDCEWQKLDTKSKKMRFVGYSLTSKGYRLFDETNQKLQCHTHPKIKIIKIITVTYKALNGMAPS